MITLTDYLVVSGALFAVGAYGLVTKRNAMRLVFSVEMLINAANINFIAFNRYLWPEALGQTIVLFSIALAAGEAAVILAVVVVAYRLHEDVDVSELRSLEG
ncbi:MAG: NADH-quinone oxidoreductase subunit NuoK [Nitrososphaerota archaeon]|nr:NADH-quinone oxidoreductase subunit NuoK [Nitrososphaerota archaeon]